MSERRYLSQGIDKLCGIYTKLELHLVQENLVLDKNSKAGDLTILGLNVVMAQN